VDIKRIILCGIGIFCGYKAVNTFSAASGTSNSILGGYASAMATVIIALVWATFSGMAFAGVLVPRLSNWFTGFIYLPLQYLKSPPEKLAQIKGMIEQQNYDEAMERLNEILERTPFEPSACLLLSEIYFYHIGEGIRGAELIINYFSQPKLKALPENIELLMRYCDYASDNGASVTAIRLLEQELQRKGYSNPENHAISLRLEAVKTKNTQHSPIVN
jgi:hypothetical protein